MLGRSRVLIASTARLLAVSSELAFTNQQLREDLACTLQRCRAVRSGLRRDNVPGAVTPVDSGTA
ncbi:hypothetical protein [Nocardia crassostreae]|uniref:hypothetical protein n=1 Tax=Nocardia crassostreae TaxID=53428 RepID=UPI00082CD73F|nr:hypothetical protein [Nocardia crassostreae]